MEPVTMFSLVWEWQLPLIILKGLREQAKQT